MRLILTGDISRTFDYKMQFEGFSSSADQQGKALITVQDMYLRAKIRPQIHIWAGQFPVPLTIENYDISPGTLEVPNFSHAILKMVCRNAVSGYTPTDATAACKPRARSCTATAGTCSPTTSPSSTARR